MTTIRAPHFDASALADGPFLAGRDDRDGTVHAVARQVAIDTTEGGGNRQVLTYGVCRRPCRLAFTIGSFVPGNEWLNRHGQRCADCAWILALERDEIDAQLAALTPEGRDLELTARLLDEPMAARDIARAMLNAAAYRGPGRDGSGDVRPTPLSAQLGHLTRHAPAILLPEGCAEYTCDHPDAPGAVGVWAECTYPIIDIACPQCSLVAVDGYAGEWTGDFHDECTVAAPCGVLRAFGAYYNVTVGGRRSFSEPVQTLTADSNDEARLRARRV
jgi:hypothetical protein